MHPFVAAHYARMHKQHASRVPLAFVRVGADVPSSTPVSTILAQRAIDLDKEVKKTTAAVDSFFISDQTPESFDAQADKYASLPFGTGDAKAAELRGKAKALRALQSGWSPAQHDAVTDFYRYWTPFLTQWNAYYDAGPWGQIDNDHLPPGFASKDALVKKTTSDLDAYEKSLMGLRSRYAILIGTVSVPADVPVPLPQPIDPSSSSATPLTVGMSTGTKVAIGVVVVGLAVIARNLGSS